MTYELRKFTTRRSFLKAAGVTAAGLAGLGGLELAQRAAAGQKTYQKLVALPPLPIKEMTIGFTDGYVSMPAGAEPVACATPDPSVLGKADAARVTLPAARLLKVTVVSQGG